MINVRNFYFFTNCTFFFLLNNHINITYKFLLNNINFFFLKIIFYSNKNFLYLN